MQFSLPRSCYFCFEYAPFFLCQRRTLTLCLTHACPLVAPVGPTALQGCLEAAHFDGSFFSLLRKKVAKKSGSKRGRKRLPSESKPPLYSLIFLSILLDHFFRLFSIFFAKKGLQKMSRKYSEKRLREAENLLPHRRVGGTGMKQGECETPQTHTGCQPPATFCSF